jgi:protein-tyrosine phosphatase
MPDFLFVCLGNICRSPLMEALARAHWPADAGPARFDSAGTGGWQSGEAPDARAIAVAARHGLDIAGQRARAVCDEDFARFDLILCADRANLAALHRRMPPGARARLALLLEWTGTGAEIADPYGAGPAAFEAVFAQVAAAARALPACWHARIGRGPPP